MPADIAAGEMRRNKWQAPPIARYAVGRRDLLGTYLIDIVAMFMAMPTVLFPAFAQDVLQRPEMLGLLYSAGTVGALIASLCWLAAERIPLPRLSPGAAR